MTTTYEYSATASTAAAPGDHGIAVELFIAKKCRAVLRHGTNQGAASSWLPEFHRATIDGKTVAQVAAKLAALGLREFLPMLREAEEKIERLQAEEAQ